MMRKKPMLAQGVGDYSRIKDNDWPLYTQPKLDGVRCVIQARIKRHILNPALNELEVKAYSRTGKEWKNIDHILYNLAPWFALNPDIILDGELYNHDLKDDFEKIVSLVRKTKPTDKDRKESAEMVQFHCYDIIDENMSFASRNEFIKQVVPRNHCIKHVDVKMIWNNEHVEASHEDFLELGYEGSILRQNKPYECKRSWTLMKVKDFSDAEATITGYELGKGKREGTLGKFMMTDDYGNEFGCPPGKGYTYKDMKDILDNIHDYIGQRATFTYFERTKAGSYRHPLFKCIRNYE